MTSNKGNTDATCNEAQNQEHYPVDLLLASKYPGKFNRMFLEKLESFDLTKANCQRRVACAELSQTAISSDLFPPYISLLKTWHCVCVCFDQVLAAVFDKLVIPLCVLQSDVG